MGDRANILVIDRRTLPGDEIQGIYLYTHWSGWQWPEMLREALTLGTARGRWNDAPYLTRILVTRLFEDLGYGATGGGISTQRTNGEYELIILDIPRQEVSFTREGSEGDMDAWYGTQTFEDFCAQVEARYPADLAEDAAVVPETLELEA